MQFDEKIVNFKNQDFTDFSREITWVIYIIDKPDFHMRNDDVQDNFFEIFAETFESFKVKFNDVIISNDK